jgi:5-methylcytosine-specific restriction endonuclease McrA
VERMRYQCHRDVLRLLQSIVGKSAFPIGPTNAATHGAVIAHRAVADHVVPRKRGGPTSAGNLVTACYPCNFGKAEYTLEELGLLAPRPAVVDGWDGLQSLVPALKKQSLRARSGAPTTSRAFSAG